MSNRFTVFYPMPQEGVTDCFIENGSGIHAKVEGSKSPERDQFISDLLGPHKYHEKLVKMLKLVMASNQDFIECENSEKLGRPDIKWSEEIQQEAAALLARLDTKGEE